MQRVLHPHANLERGGSGNYPLDGQIENGVRSLTNEHLAQKKREGKRGVDLDFGKRGLKQALLQLNHTKN